MPTREHFGRYLEEFTVGETIDHWPGRTITEADNVLFCMLTMNHHPLHIDSHYAESTQFGQNVVVGNLVVDIAFGMSVADVSGKAIANLEYERITHDLPVFQGDTLYAESEILEVRESRSRPDRGIVYIESRGFNQRGEKVLTLRRRFLVPKREA